MEKLKNSGQSKSFKANSEKFEVKVLSEMYDNIINTCKTSNLLFKELDALNDYGIDLEWVLEDKTRLSQQHRGHSLSGFPVDGTFLFDKLQEKKDLYLIQEDLKNLDIYEDRQLLESFDECAVLKIMPSVNEVYLKMYNAYLYENFEELVKTYWRD